jgi:hypothetical protein
MKSNLVKKSKELRDESLLKNDYREGINEYNTSNKDTQADGDNRGREEVTQGIVGNRLDIEKRIELKNKNTYTPENGYFITED